MRIRFFLYASHNSIHSPLLENEELINKYKVKRNSTLPENNPVIGAMIETLDESVGTILNKIKELDLENNTIVLFFSDNGHHGQKSGTPFRGSKGDLYEGGIRMPLIVRWPGVTRSDSVCEGVVISNDFFPTFNDIDGVSFFPLLKDSNVSLDREAIYWHFPHYHGAGLGPQGAIRMGPYKLIEWFEKLAYGESDAFELYDLVNDPNEQENLADTMPEVTAKLKDKLKAWREQVGAQMMTKRK